MKDLWCDSFDFFILVVQGMNSSLSDIEIVIGLGQRVRPNNFLTNTITHQPNGHPDPNPFTKDIYFMVNDTLL